MGHQHPSAKSNADPGDRLLGAVCSGPCFRPAGGDVLRRSTGASGSQAAPGGSAPMKLSRNVLLSCEILAAHKLRTLLSVLGMLVGVGAVVLMVSVGRGAEGRYSKAPGRCSAPLR